MKIHCCSCDKLITTPGALVFGPPFKNNKEKSVSTVHKYHVCIDCWPILSNCLEHLENAKIVKGK